MTSFQQELLELIQNEPMDRNLILDQIQITCAMLESAYNGSCKIVDLNEHIEDLLLQKTALYTKLNTL